MLFVWLIEALLIIGVIIIGWKFIVRPIYRILTRPRRRGASTLDDVIGDTNPGEVLAERKRQLGDELTLEQADDVERKIAEVRNRRTTHTTTQENVK